jgi:hypothetical protein
MQPPVQAGDRLADAVVLLVRRVRHNILIAPPSAGPHRTGSDAKKSPQPT